MCCNMNECPSIKIYTSKENVSRKKQAAKGI